MFQIDPNILAERALYVGGEWVKGSGEPLISVNPATGESNATFATASEADVDHAVNVARASLQSSGWADMQQHRRADHLHAIARLLVDRVEPLAQIAMRENGKTLAESRQQVRGAAGIFRYYASLCETLGSEVTPSRGEHISFTLYEPWGVVAAVTPWNSPVNLAAEKLAPALAAGNAVVLKPSEITSIVSLELGRLCVDAGLPAGLVNVLPGTAAASRSLAWRAAFRRARFGLTPIGRTAFPHLSAASSKAASAASVVCRVCGNSSRLRASSLARVPPRSASIASQGIREEIRRMNKAAISLTKLNRCPVINLNIKPCLVTRRAVS